MFYNSQRVPSKPLEPGSFISKPPNFPKKEFYFFNPKKPQKAPGRNVPTLRITRRTPPPPQQAFIWAGFLAVSSLAAASSSQQRAHRTPLWKHPKKQLFSLHPKTPARRLCSYREMIPKTKVHFGPGLIHGFRA